MNVSFSAGNVFAVIGPLFLVLGAIRCVSARRWALQGVIWLVIGAIFGVVAVCLR